jgi:PAS domain-containing protein
MLLYLNSDLTGRIEEISINWSPSDLIQISRNGAKALGIQFSTDIENRISSICYGNAGILQSILLKTLDHLGITETVNTPIDVHDLEALDFAAMQYAEQLNPLYQQFAKTVSAGIRARKNSTGIYAHAMAVIIESSDKDLLDGMSLAVIHDRAYAREPRIQKGNLRAVLENFPDLQVDQNGKGIVIAYNEMTEEITIVDKQLLLYRKYMTITWPWEQLVAESKESSV